MNKTLMLVICDFLLLSMLALARFDPPEEKPEPALDATASSATAEAELIELLEESLQAEQGSRENLSSDLQETRASLQEKAQKLAEREAALAETMTNLEKTSAEAQELAQAKAEVEAKQSELAAEREQLAQRYEATREELQKASEERVELANTLGAVKEERSVSEERLKQTEQALREREAQLARREAELKAAREEREKLAQQQAELNKALEVAQTEQRLLSENLTKEQREKAEAFARADRLTDNVAVLGQGVNQLGQGVSQIGQNVTNIAQSSEAIQKEIEASRPQTMSEIFTRFQQNRATIRFTSQEQGLLGGTVERSYESRSILVVGQDENYYLVTHSDNSPFSLSKSARVESATLTIQTGSERIQVNQIGFLATDPRLIFIPLPKIFAESSGLEPFPLALQPERWEEAVLVKNDESNFGRTEFRRLTSSARFLKMERPALGELFADFAASRGDLAFTKNSQFVGLLTDTRHAVVIEDFVASAVLNLGSRFEPETARSTIDKMQDRVRQLPSEVR
ncbi:hypothetical protein DDZ13_11500 [Coraliomargarita sinensis]|uniref:Chromosome partition protein Smc n=1 Tax=Coraliomargarita sinensis TaxID=2174842 RepID=A0A317ZI66_9BACT|nr:hypothetical protein [Coraliomargarita sinensis]PXA03598.1 hypothetical protein DDZ13_11500 [Coraliomargarita sinensis]